MDNYTDKHLAEYDLTNETLKEIDITDVRDIIKYKEDIKRRTLRMDWNLLKCYLIKDISLR